MSPTLKAKSSPPPLDQVWLVVKANLIVGLLVVVLAVAFASVWVRDSSADDRRAAKEAVERRDAICMAVVYVGPTELARALRQPTESPALTEYRTRLNDALGFCGPLDIPTTTTLVVP